MSAEDQKIVVEENTVVEETPVVEEPVEETPVEEAAPEEEEKEVPAPYEFTIKAPIDNVRIGGDALDQARRYCLTGFK